MGRLAGSTENMLGNGMGEGMVGLVTKIELEILVAAFSAYLQVKAAALHYISPFLFLHCRLHWSKFYLGGCSLLFIPYMHSCVLDLCVPHSTSSFALSCIRFQVCDVVFLRATEME